MKKVGLIFIFMMCSFLAEATHIVGGGFSYRKVSGNIYQFNLNLFFDFINGNVGAKDESATCFLFSKSNNALVASLFLPLVDDSRFLPFTNPRCAIGSNISTRILVYQATYEMSPLDFKDPKGYYIVWERCCRNNIVSNIILPGETGQTFYMEFPPVIRNGLPFNNDSPVFIDLKSDYPCVNQAFSLSFKANDSDGDSLVYSFTAPLKGNSTVLMPRDGSPFPAPYSLVNWAPDFSTQMPLPGNPGLQIDTKTGLVTCKASLIGLYVFSVLCEEFRKGLKIGEVRQEMQLNVKDCLFNTPPNLVAKNPLSSLELNNEDTLKIKSGSRSECYILRLTDAQQNQTLRFRARSFSANTPTSIQKDTTVTLIQAGDSVSVRFCIPACAVVGPINPWKILLIATDDGCSQPLSDSLILNLVIDRKPTLPPIIQTIGFVKDTIEVIQTELFNFQVEALQTENGNLTVFSRLVDSQGNPISLQTNGIVVPTGNGSSRVVSSFNWPEICFLPENQPLKLTTIVRSLVCDSVKFDTLIRYIKIIPQKLEVNISSDYPGLGDISMEENASVNFKLTGTASESRSVNLTTKGSLSTIPGFLFQSSSGFGTTNSPFSFNTDCASPSGVFEARFISSSTFCGKKYQDSLSYNIRIIKAEDTLKYLPNLLTVNGDGKNDGFNILEILAENNCKLNFDFVEIYDRWGIRVFYSKEINFNWKPDRRSLGVFFFALHFKERTIKDWLTVVR